MNMIHLILLIAVLTIIASGYFSLVTPKSKHQHKVILIGHITALLVSVLVHQVLIQLLTVGAY